MKSHGGCEWMRGWAPAVYGLAVPRRRATALAIALLAACLGEALAGCRASAPTSTPTPSPVERVLVGKWEVRGGTSPKAQVIVGEQVEFLADGTYTWGKQEGSYSVFQDRAITLRSTYGEDLHYDLAIWGEALTLSRGTPCGKEERFELQRLKQSQTSP